MNQNKKGNPIARAYRFYVDGFKGLSRTSRILWLIIGIKLFVMFAVLKPFFFPNHTKKEAQRLEMTGAEFVQNELIDRGVDE